MTPIPGRNTERVTSIPEPQALWQQGLGPSLGNVRFGSPWSGETRRHEEALERWFQGGCSGPAPQRSRPDVLDPFRDVWVGRPKKLVSIRLDEWLLALVKAMAAQAGTPYQEILRTWMEEGLRRALEEGLSDASADQREQATE